MTTVVKKNSRRNRAAPWMVVMSASLSRPEASSSLVLAMVASSIVPLLLLDETLSVIAASKSFCHAFAIHPADVRHQSLFELGDGEWEIPQLRSLLSGTLSGGASVEAYEMDIKIRGGHPRQLVLNAQKLDYEDDDHARLLLTISDVTDARVADRHRDDLVREKGILLQELQHRIANSLQIIASVLLQSARKMQTDESRFHLHAAHNRVLSIAAVQQQLAASKLGDIALGPYFKQLCESLGASMIRDPNQLQIVVSTDDSIVKSDASVSLGLIVTELVINALKYAFTGSAPGTIVVDYQTHDGNWTLSVTDNGVGMPLKAPKPGLGTSIVEALARQLGARIDVVDARPGTAILVVHDTAIVTPFARAV